MAVISISIETSTTEIVAGIPRSIIITTNIPSLIFYTLDGSVPSLFSTQYTGAIFLPTNKPAIVVNVLATNGTDTSPILTETYQTDMVDGNVRFSRNSTNAPPGFDLQELYPFGNNEPQPEQLFGNPADIGITVNNPALPSTPTGYDGTATGTGTGFTNNPYNLVNYNIKYSTTNAEGETGPGIGNLPANFTSPPSDLPPAYDGEQTDQFSATFNPKAFVIFQDLSKEDPNDPPQINKMNFVLENEERARDGNFYSNSSGSPSTSASFVRSEYNARTGNITYYYYDNSCCRWIISTQAFTPNVNHNENLFNSRVMNGGAGKVFEWIPFKRQVLG